ncbi:unnamed protein product [Moneuplotes crassus]|uniref:Uncharacterized protein n=1 Tax=Euplotes crassus TaxID=5936 RepID=A0AAD1XXS3_EUPCR|nr:unnamed protein product [Moneuplotes crassus]
MFRFVKYLGIASAGFIFITADKGFFTNLFKKFELEDKDLEEFEAFYMNVDSKIEDQINSYKKWFNDINHCVKDEEKYGHKYLHRFELMYIPNQFDSNKNSDSDLKEKIGIIFDASGMTPVKHKEFVRRYTSNGYEYRKFPKTKTYYETCSLLRPEPVSEYIGNKKFANKFTEKIINEIGERDEGAYPFLEVYFDDRIEYYAPKNNISQFFFKK